MRSLSIQVLVIFSFIISINTYQPPLKVALTQETVSGNKLSVYLYQSKLDFQISLLDIYEGINIPERFSFIIDEKE